jgi:sugar (pentulose or hexulose) kinase
MLADALGRPVSVSRSEEVGALGVALLAGVATGFWSDVREALAVSSPAVDRFEPDPDSHEQYARVLATYQFLRRDLAAERGFGGES